VLLPLAFGSHDIQDECCVSIPDLTFFSFMFVLACLSRCIVYDVGFASWNVLSSKFLGMFGHK
jgi:hypothetical protein